MGLIQKQSIQGTIYSYLGVLIGFANTILLFPRILSNDQIGLMKVLVAYAVLFAQFGGLGMPSVITRYFPLFRNAQNRNNGFFLISVLVSLLGFLLCLLLFFILKPWIIQDSVGNSPLFIEYLYYLIPLIFFTLIFNMLDAYSKVLFDAVIGTSLKEFYQRILISIVILLFSLGWLNFPEFVLGYVVALSLPTLILAWVLYQRDALSLIPHWSFISKDLRKEMISVGSFSVFSGFTILVILNVDSLMIKSLLGLDKTGVYSTVFFFGTLVVIPSRALIKISSTMIAEAWKENDLATINNIYVKSCLTQTIVGSLIFIGIWANVDNIFRILPDGRGFEEARNVVFYIGLANLFEMMTGVNNNILANSSYYRYHTWFMVFLVALVVGTNLIFIPWLGITGASLASALSVFLYSLVRVLFLHWKLGFQPFDRKYIWLALVSGFSFFLGWIIPEWPNLYWDILVRSSIIALSFILLVYFLRLSEDINGRIEAYAGWAWSMVKSKR
jgi:O-antigen/teichoic acid export membrane protein